MAGKLSRTNNRKENADGLRPSAFIGFVEVNCYFRFPPLIMVRVNLTSACLRRNICFFERILANLGKYLASISPSLILALESASAARKYSESDADFFFSPDRKIYMGQYLPSAGRHCSATYLIKHFHAMKAGFPTTKTGFSVLPFFFS